MSLTVNNPFVQHWMEAQLTPLEHYLLVRLVRAVGEHDPLTTGSRRYNAGTGDVVQSGVEGLKEYYPEKGALFSVEVRASSVSLGQWGDLQPWLRSQEDIIGKRPVPSAAPLPDPAVIRGCVGNPERVNTSAQTLLHLYTQRYGFKEAALQPCLDRLLVMAYAGLRPKSLLDKVLARPYMSRSRWNSFEPLEAGAGELQKYRKQLEPLLGQTRSSAVPEAALGATAEGVDL